MNLYPAIRSIGIGVPAVVADGVIGICDIKELENYPLKEQLENQFNHVIEGSYQYGLVTIALDALRLTPLLN